MNNKQQIETSLKSLILDDDREFVAMLSGKWGIGKTYFWREFTTKHLKEKAVVYISLFGKNSLVDIETEIVTKLYKYNKGLKKYTKHLDTVGNMASKAMGLPINVSIGSLLSLFKASDFKNTIICFDDFERLSDKVPLKDVMGLISQFKEQKECKVIMILNEKELDKLSDIDGKKHDEIFALYKEKVVDYNFHYQPSQEELFEAIKENIAIITFCEHQTIYDFFKRIDLKNIRIMKQALYQLKHFEFIKNYHLDEKVINDFVEIALNLFVFKTKTNFNYLKFKKLLQYQVAKSVASQLDQKNKIKSKYEKSLKSLTDLGFIYLQSELETEIYTYIDTHIIDKEKINSLLSTKTSKINFKQIHDEIDKLNNGYFVSFKTNEEDISKNLINKLRKNSNMIHFIFSYHNFKQFIENIRKYTPHLSLATPTEKTIIENYIKHYTNRPEEDHHGPINENSYIKKILEEYSWGQSYLDDHKKSTLSTSINDIPLIMEKVYETRHFSDAQLYQLNLFTDEDYKSIIINSSSYEFTKTIIQFCSGSISGENTEPIKIKITQALRKIGNINGEFKRKVEYIANHAKLNLKEEK